MKPKGGVRIGDGHQEAIEGKRNRARLSLYSLGPELEPNEAAS